MKIWIAGETCQIEREVRCSSKLPQRLLSYFFLSTEKSSHLTMEYDMKNNVDLFLDSGAFSAFTQNTEININEYISFIKEHKNHLEVYANLDSIGDPKQTWKNQKVMEKAGLHPLPCFHYNEPIKYLKRYVKKYDYIALGGMVPISTKDLQVWLDDMFQNYICDKDGMPKVKVHGFGMTSLVLMLRYPWYSVDSTSWVMASRMGTIYIPRFKNGKWFYDENCWKISVSAKSPNLKDKNKHISTMSPKIVKVILDYLEDKGYLLGKSEFKEVPADYEPTGNERWACAKKERTATGKGHVENIIKPGLCNDYKLRDEVNIIYFKDLQEALPEWPWKLNLPKVNKGFGI